MPENKIVLGTPTFRALRQMNNLVARQLSIKNGELVEGNIDNAADMEIMVIMAYVREAPFKPELEAFLEFCDKLDDNRLGSATELYSEMQSIVKEYRESEKSPFVS